ncbi:hypothetical protein BpHYR1_028831 [Brachionus plicatilis]|uniref:C2H2-type domain-containing protein n=1 Tax=Brachionus plicatilis TaxID=10195 RepID=A0A3M7PXJ2_BRAPC|nr:hypothetical protein BpHYR1_028831 [Brachionus plicatilis]
MIRSFEVYIIKSLRLVWYTRAMAAISTSQVTLNVVKKALSKYVNPVPCEICGELMKNIKGVKLHIAENHKICEQKFGEHKVHILSKILMVTFFGELRFTFWARPACAYTKINEINFTY